MFQTKRITKSKKSERSQETRDHKKEEIIRGETTNINMEKSTLLAILLVIMITGIQGKHKNTHHTLSMNYSA